ncbi:2-iminoacetate synthase ThiH [Oceanirhabdus sp. W0125-5]|uniref:2-iminoacetate synthase ThiH n=1 Tax=Oceanirhabdus sp. W0125-5 TaxID=2999116 RepID=UPI0022F344BB|nr:2-iminoacetate synthase ThiH [Oceanirhabdus sp. W0125-5]WBW95532.1 2-iminoacetate synthase ThiH [Oceanirhabdus sp. W0125-5]
MSFSKVLDRLDDKKILQEIEQVSSNDIINILNKDQINEKEFLQLLSPEGAKYIEEIAQNSRRNSLKHFGKAITLYTPLYISNYCVNRCLYCSFNCNNSIMRNKLTLDEIREEAEEVCKTGIKHVLLLTGESKIHSPVEYIKDSVQILRDYFQSVVLEVYPMDTDEYVQLVGAGIDGVTIYQETYDREIYESVHIKGPKRDYLYRLDTPERACSAGVRTINIGALIGLNDWRIEIFKVGLHAKYISEKFPEVEIGISLPRIKGISSTEKLSYKYYETNDRDFVQILAALKLFLPHCSINISTRESKSMRENLIPIGVNKMSAGVSTEVGGHKVNKSSDKQFEISDESSVEDVIKMIERVGYQPVLKDWMLL